MVATILSRAEAEALIAENAFPKNTAVISFYDPAIKRIDKTYTHIDYSGVCDMVYYSELDDLDLDVLCDRGYTCVTYFPEADEIADFIIKAHDCGKDIICQCEYGQSRSAGCAAAIREYFYHDGIWLFADPKRCPNQLVFRKVYDALAKPKDVLEQGIESARERLKSKKNTDPEKASARKVKVAIKRSRKP